MKKIISYSSCLLLLLVAGCNKYLDKEPDNRAKLNSAEKISQLLGTAYPESNYQAIGETMSDNVTDIGNGQPDNTIHDLYFYIDTKENQEDSPEKYWFACYSAIAAANLALQTISQQADPTTYKNQKGEALVARAYAHFMLVNFFSKFYDATTAFSDPGIPYVTQPETVVIKQYDRKTVQYVYDMVERDLLEGLPLIEDKSYNVPKYHFNRAAANAFATRFYLFKKNYSKAIQYANVAIPGSNFIPFLRGWNSTYQNITDVTELSKIYAKATEPANLLLVQTASVWARNYYTVRYGVGQDKQSEIFPRPDPITGGNFAFKQYSIYEGTHALVPKIDEYFVKVSVNANIGDAYVMVPLFTAEEVLFNQAESYAYTGNIAGALANLNAYASTRILNYSASNNITEAKLKTVFRTNDSKSALIAAILYYKRAEFIHEGMRWFDILRYKIPVVHTVKGGTTITLGADDPRRVLQLPQSTTLAGLQPNPR
ncbi:MAG: RagB/SusD family nutrient uptake outer membrane protein [Bacteroidota bacterium]|nr:RagB/SusD family nutrient uptake outer membrane protein [Bacteroidota bacterium]